MARDKVMSISTSFWFLGSFLTKSGPSFYSDGAKENKESPGKVDETLTGHRRFTYADEKQYTQL